MAFYDFLVDMPDQFKNAEWRDKAESELNLALKDGMKRAVFMRHYNSLLEWDRDSESIPDPLDIYKVAADFRVDAGTRLVSVGDAAPSVETVQRRATEVANEASAAWSSFSTETTRAAWSQTPWWVVTLVALGGTYLLLCAAAAVVVTVREVRTGTAP